MKEYSRQDVLQGMKDAIAFLEIHPDLDLPEGMERFLIRSLRVRVAGQLSQNDCIDWFYRQLVELEPDEIISNSDLTAIRHFTGGVTIVAQVRAGEVFEHHTEKIVVNKPTEETVHQWLCPEILSTFGFKVNYEQLLEEQRSLLFFQRQ